MKLYNYPEFEDLFVEINNSKKNVARVQLSNDFLTDLKYFLITKRFNAYIIDDYSTEIFGEMGLYEALFYELKLINTHSLNWNAIKESLLEKLNRMEEFDGICLILRNLNEIFIDYSYESKLLSEMITCINSENKNKRILLIINEPKTEI